MVESRPDWWRKVTVGFALEDFGSEAGLSKMATVAWEEASADSKAVGSLRR